jgi:hypothetical protein
MSSLAGPVGPTVRGSTYVGSTHRLATEVSGDLDGPVRGPDFPGITGARRPIVGGPHVGLASHSGHVRRTSPRGCSGLL